VRGASSREPERNAAKASDLQKLDAGLVHSASDLNAYTECVHLTALEAEVAAGLKVRPERTDATADLLARKGDEHERRYLERLRERYGAGLVAFEERPAQSRAAYMAAEAAGVAAMARGVPMIYQATFFDGTFLGRADFLRRVERPSARWPWSYEVVDTKLALSAKPYFLVQLCNYSEHVARIQGTAPECAAIVLGTGAEWSFRVEDFAAYYRRLKAAYLAAVAAGEDAYPLECAHCDLCAWREACARRRDRDDHLSLVAGIRRDQIVKLESSGIATLAALAAAGDDARPKKLAAQTYATLRLQAAEQHKYRDARARNGTARHTYSFRAPADAKSGFARLPEPDAGDIFFDMEGDPMYAPGRPLEYLFGIYLPASDEYVPFWATTPAGERRAFEAFVDFVVARRHEYPNLHVYHYAPYETTALKRLMGVFGSREEEIDGFLRAGTFVDLYPVVKQGVFISQPSYSIKKVEALYGFERKTVTKGGDDSIVMFESWIESQDPATLEDIRAYNEDDCRSTFELREWLVRLRAERNARLDEPVPWRPVPEQAGSEEHVVPSELERTLLSGIEAPVSLDELRALPGDARARWLLGNLIHYHRRDAKPEWWEHFYRLEHPSELIDEDRKSLGGLVLCAEIQPTFHGERDRNLVYTYRFPEQEHDLGTHPLDAATGRGAGSIVEVDDAAGILRIKLSGKIEPGQLRALIPGKPLNTTQKREAVEYIARSYVAGRLERDHPALHAMLLGRTPRFADRPAGARVQPERVDARSLSRLVAALDRSYLVVQGPPGSGKSTNGAHAILDLLAAGKRVALAALSHKALHNLLHKIEEQAHERGLTFRACHKSSSTSEGSGFESRCPVPLVADAKTPAAFAGCALVSATTFFWSDELQRGAFDVVVIDEAGQISLGDALVTALVARDVVLLGDPQQLPQVSQGTHPVGSDRSILEHLLDDRPTIPADRGVFLDRSYRIHPDIDRFISKAFYEGRLEADAPNARNRIDLDGIARAGVRYLAVAHDGNARRSNEESERIVAAIAELLRTGSATIRDRATRPLTEADVLVVTPYNAQRSDLAGRLAARGLGGVRVGTVDKFQGQEAPVVFYSMATSSAELAPRGLEFLLSPNRFNVAISRAQALAIVACSPLLPASRAKTIGQMRLLNLLCAYLEEAASGGAERDASEFG